MLTCILRRDKRQGSAGFQEPHLESQMLQKVTCPIVLLSLVTAADINPHPDLHKKPSTKVTNHPSPNLHPTQFDLKEAPGRGVMVPGWGDSCLSRTPVLGGTAVPWGTGTG